MSEPYKYTIDVFENATITIEGDGVGSSSLSSTGLKSEEVGDELYNANIDGMESILLAMAHEGVDLTTKAVVNAIGNAVSAADDNTSEYDRLYRFL